VLVVAHGDPLLDPLELPEDSVVDPLSVDVDVDVDVDVLVVVDVDVPVDADVDVDVLVSPSVVGMPGSKSRLLPTSKY